MTSIFIPLPFVLLNLEKVEVREKNTKIWRFWERIELFRWNKKHFSVFEGLSVGEKYFIKNIKILNIKNILNIKRNIKELKVH